MRTLATHYEKEGKKKKQQKKTTKKKTKKNKTYITDQIALLFFI